MPIKQNIAISENGFLFDTSSGNTFSCNPLGVEILEYLKHDTSVDEICKKIVEKYEVEPDNAEKDIWDFIRMLNQHQITTQQ